MKPLKTKYIHIENVIINWYGEITFKILKKNTHKIHKNKSPFRYFNHVPIGHKKIDKWKEKFISKQPLKTKSNYAFSNVHKYHLVKVSQKKKSH